MTFNEMSDEFETKFKALVPKIDGLTSASLKRVLKTVLAGNLAKMELGDKEREAVEAGLELERMKLEMFVQDIQERHEPESNADQISENPGITGETGHNLQG